MPGITTFLYNAGKRFVNVTRAALLLDIWPIFSWVENLKLIFGYSITLSIAALKPIAAAALSQALQMIADEKDSIEIGGRTYTPTQLLYISIGVGSLAFLDGLYNSHVISPIARKHEEDLITEYIDLFSSKISYEEFLEQKGKLEGTDNGLNSERGALPPVLGIYNKITETTFSNLIPRIGAIIFGLGAPFVLQNKDPQNTDPDFSVLSGFIAGYIFLAWLFNEILSNYFSVEEAKEFHNKASETFHRQMYWLTRNQLSVRIYQRISFEKENLQSLNKAFNSYASRLDRTQSRFRLIDILFAVMQMGYIAYITKDGFGKQEIRNVTYMLSYLGLLHGNFTSITHSVAQVIHDIDTLVYIKDVKTFLQSKVFKTQELEPQPQQVESEVFIQNLSYKPRGRPNFVYHGFNINIAPKSLTLITGASGIGKTTLLELISHLRIAQSGEIYLNRQNLNSLELNAIFSKLVYIPVDICLFETKPVIYNLLYGVVSDNHLKAIKDLSTKADIIANLAMYPGAPTEQDCQEILEEFGISDLLERNDCMVSKGQMQRIGLARGIMRAKRNPDICVILIDEATANLDAESAQKVKDIITNLNEYTRIVVTHDQEGFGNPEVIKIEPPVAAANALEIEIPADDENAPLLGVQRRGCIIS